MIVNRNDALKVAPADGSRHPRKRIVKRGRCRAFLGCGTFFLCSACCLSHSKAVEAFKKVEHTNIVKVF